MSEYVEFYLGFGCSYDDEENLEKRVKGSLSSDGVVFDSDFCYEGHGEYLVGVETFSAIFSNGGAISADMANVWPALVENNLHEDLVVLVLSESAEQLKKVRLNEIIAAFDDKFEEKILMGLWENKRPIMESGLLKGKNTRDYVNDVPGL